MLECVGVKVEGGVSGGKSLECVWESDEGEATCMSQCEGKLWAHIGEW